MDELGRPTLTRRTFLAGSLAFAGAVTGGCRPGRRDASARPDVTTTTARPPAPAAAAAEYWPPSSGAWETVEPAAAGWDPEGVEEALALAGDRSTRSLRIVVGGRMLAERHWDVGPDFARDIASCQKSVLSLLVLRARDQGLVALDDPVSKHLGPGWSAARPDEEGGITIRHLLTMTSGLDDELRRTAPPGTRWHYNNTAYHRLRPVLEAVTAKGIQAVTDEWLFSPIGIRSSTWYERPGAPDPTGRKLWGLRMTTADMARFGLLVQRGGTWDLTEVIARTSVDEATTPSQALNPTYGYLWWLNGRTVDSRIPGAPPDLVAALGQDDQKIYVSRDLDLVVTRLGGRGGPPTWTSPDSFNSAFLTALAAAAPA